MLNNNVRKISGGQLPVSFFAVFGMTFSQQ